MYPDVMKIKSRNLMVGSDVCTHPYTLFPDDIKIIKTDLASLNFLKKKNAAIWNV